MNRFSRKKDNNALWMNGKAGRKQNVKADLGKANSSDKER